MSVNSKMTAIADAIRAKTGGTELLTLDGMAQAVGDISGAGTDTSDATATAQDLVAGVTAYADGEKVTGSMPAMGSLFWNYRNQDACSAYYEDEGIVFDLDVEERKYVDPGTLTFSMAADFAGNARPDNVVAGATFTSAAGFCVTGTHICQAGMDTSDATATADDIAAGKTAYGSSGKITGTLESGNLTLPDAQAYGFYGEIAMRTSPEAKRILNTDDTVILRAGAGQFGNATAEDVAEGVTFTSAAGFAVTGTHVCTGGTDTSDATATAQDLAAGVTAYAGGKKLTGSMPVMNRLIWTHANPDAGSAYYEDGGIVFDLDVEERKYVDPGTLTFTMASDFAGNARPEDVVAGATFTSAKGFAITGTHVCTELPELTNPGTAGDLASGKQLIDADGNVVDGTLTEVDDYYNDETWNHLYFDAPYAKYDVEAEIYNIFADVTLENDVLFRKDVKIPVHVIGHHLGSAKPEDVAQGVTFTSENGLKIEGTALIPGGGSVFPDGAFSPVASFTDGKQYALVAVIDGVRRYINTSTYNNYTMNATQIAIAEDAGDYVIFSNTPALFTAVASGDGFLLQNGSNYLHGTSSGGTALRVGTTQMVWTVDDSATGGFSEGKYYAKEDTSAVWLMNSSGGYNWSIKYETAGSFGYDRAGRDSTYSTGFVSFVLYEYVAGEKTVSPIVDTSDATATADDILQGKTAYVGGRKIEGGMAEGRPYYFQFSGDIDVGYEDGAIYFAHTFGENTFFRKGQTVQFFAHDLGDATAADVAEGKTFTTGNGVKIVGTASSL